ncbi:hypothetical protein J5N97_027691 [Dioscorea zingiberensis]|uniref:BZIP domain-containing protein n=1 Tax=Dioscorea zingiberensis TaxID=325984 RepID=A0A9D5H471_9LILI|nr:hypothetical protein J5N97_027691 [Dioscorea zingiberensis]
MVASIGGSSGSSHGQNSSSELMEQRKQKRMLSNRDSARRSRMRKQKHLDDLMNQVNQLRKEKNQFLTSLNYTTQQYLVLESENSVLRTQMMELTSRLQSLNEILHFMSLNNNTVTGALFSDEAMVNETTSLRPWNMMFLNQQPMVMDMFQYC